MAVPTLVTGQHARAHSAVSVASLSVSLPGAATPGNSVHVNAVAFNYTFTGTEITDNQGNGAYPLDAMAQTAGAGVDAIFSKQNVAASGTFTVTDTFSPNSHGDLYVAEFSGVAATGALDKHVTSTPTPTGNPSVWTGPASGVLAQAGELVIVASNAVGNIVTTMSITTAGYTVIDNELDGTQYDVSLWGWKVAADTSTQQAAYQEGENSTTLGTCPSLIVTYKAAADVSPSPGILIPNRNVGPMALRQQFRRPDPWTRTAPELPVTTTPPWPIRIPNPRVGPMALRNAFKWQYWPQTPPAVGGIKDVVPSIIAGTGVFSATVTKFGAVTPNVVVGAGTFSATVTKFGAVRPSGITGAGVFAATVTKLAAIKPSGITGAAVFAAAVTKLAAVKPTVVGAGVFTAAVSALKAVTPTITGSTIFTAVVTGGSGARRRVVNGFVPAIMRLMGYTNEDRR